jgi:uncharacterized protein
MIKIIYHANCTDGFCSALLFWLKYEGSEEYIPMNYGQELDLSKFNKEDIVYILDFSFKQPLLLDLAHNVKQVIILDHHKTAAEHLKGPFPHNITAYFDMNRSGATMSWDYLRYVNENDIMPPEELPEAKIRPLLVQYVEDRDLWKFELPNSKEISAYFQALPFDFNIWNTLYYAFDSELENITKSGAAILMKLQQQIDQAVSHAVLRVLEVAGKEVPVMAVNSTVNFSEVAGEISKHTGVGVAWLMRSDGKYQYSLRGDNVDKIALAYGGGGHSAAAGFESDTLVLKKSKSEELVGKTITYKGRLAKIVGFIPRGNHLNYSSMPSCNEWCLWILYLSGERDYISDKEWKDLKNE